MARLRKARASSPIRAPVTSRCLNDESSGDARTATSAADKSPSRKHTPARSSRPMPSSAESQNSRSRSDTCGRKQAELAPGGGGGAKLAAVRAPQTRTVPNRLAQVRHGRARARPGWRARHGRRPCGQLTAAHGIGWELLPQLVRLGVKAQQQRIHCGCPALWRAGCGSREVRKPLPVVSECRAANCRRQQRQADAAPRLQRLMWASCSYSWGLLEVCLDPFAGSGWCLCLRGGACPFAASVTRAQPKRKADRTTLGILQDRIHSSSDGKRARCPDLYNMLPRRNTGDGIKQRLDITEVLGFTNAAFVPVRCRAPAAASCPEAHETQAQAIAWCEFRRGWAPLSAFRGFCG